MSKQILGAVALLVSLSAQADGLVFQCSNDQAATLQPAVTAYLVQEGVRAEWQDWRRTDDGRISVGLVEPLASVAPVDQFFDARFGLVDERFVLPTGKPGVSKTVLTVSRKEILTSLLAKGRTTEVPCSVETLAYHVKERQSIVAWTERVEFGWPDGGPARWNKTFWDRGTPLAPALTVDAVADVFFAPKQYEVGCYTAAKLVVMQGVLQHAAQPGNSHRLPALLSQLWSNNDPLVGFEPGEMWSIFPETSAEELAQPGKWLKLLPNVAAHNFVPGDWLYMLNTDEASSKHTGYEGSNAIYLGRGKFSDYYNDRNHFYTYLEKLDEVYQWRNEVFSRSRHLHKVQPLTADQVRALGAAPGHGGVVMPYRVVRRMD